MNRWLLGTAAVVLAALTSCSSVVPGTPSTVGGSGGGGDTDAAVSSGGGSACGSEAGFCITVSITGAVTAQGTVQSINLGTCADYAKGTSPDDGLQFPGLIGEKIGDRKITAANEIRTYNGPGTYGKDTLKSVAGVVDVSVDTTPYQLTDATTAQAVINPDGSGSFTFADLKEGEQGNPGTAKGAISGTFTWTCTD